MARMVPRAAGMGTGYAGRAGRVGQGGRWWRARSRSRARWRLMTAHILSADALAFVAELQRTFGARRRAARARAERRATLAAGGSLDFQPATAATRAQDGAWRRHPLTCATDAWRSRVPPSARCSSTPSTAARGCSWRTWRTPSRPTWANVVGGQADLLRAVDRDARLHQPRGQALLPERRDRHAGRAATWLAPDRAAPAGRRRAGVREPVRLRAAPVPQRPRCARAWQRAGPGSYYYLPKLESHLEARLWNDVFLLGQERLGIPRGTIRATVLIETIWARVRDGRDPGRAPGARRGPQRGPLGLHLQPHQGIPGAAATWSCPTGRR